MQDKFQESVHKLYQEIFPFVNEALLHPKIQYNFLFALLNLSLTAEQISKAKTKKERQHCIKRFFHGRKIIEKGLSAVKRSIENKSANIKENNKHKLYEIQNAKTTG